MYRLVNQVTWFTRLSDYIIRASNAITVTLPLTSLLSGRTFHVINVGTDTVENNPVYPVTSVGALTILIIDVSFG